MWNIWIRVILVEKSWRFFIGWDENGWIWFETWIFSCIFREYWRMNRTLPLKSDWFGGEHDNMGLAGKKDDCRWSQRRLGLTPVFFGILNGAPSIFWDMNTLDSWYRTWFFFDDRDHENWYRSRAFDFGRFQCLNTLGITTVVTTIMNNFSLKPTDFEWCRYLFRL